MNVLPGSDHWSNLLAHAGPVALDAAVKSVLLLAAAALVTGAMRRGSAAARHLVWLLAVMGLFALPALSWTLPGWNILPRWMSVKPSVAAAPERPAAGAQNHGQAIARAGGSDWSYGNNGNNGTDRTDRTYPTDRSDPADPTDRPGRPAPSGAQTVNTLSASVPGSQARSAGGGAGGALPARFSAGALCMAAWLAGFALVFLRTATGVAGLWRLERGSRLETSLSWLDLLRRLASGLGLRRRVALLKSHRRRMPMTWGVMRPRLLLPEVSEAWPAERRRVVLLHELAHAWRWDYATNLVTRLACAVWWFNPLVWFAARQMAAERERACDDIVLNHGAKPAEYAEQLLEIAAGLRPGGWTECAGIAMARPTKLEGRLRAILDANRNRATLTRAAVVSALLILTAILIPVAMMKAAPAQQPANPPSLAKASAFAGPMADRTAGRQSDSSAIAPPAGTMAEIHNPQSDWGEAVNGLRTRIAADKHVFRAGEPINIHLEVTNTSDQAKTILTKTALGFAGLSVLDANGKIPPYFGPVGSFPYGSTNIGPRQTLQLQPFDLTVCCYLRHPGSYTVQLPAETHPVQPPAYPMFSLPPSGKLAFEVVADAQTDADGDPVGRLLPILPEEWWLMNLGSQIGPLRPGSNRVEATGRALKLHAPYWFHKNLDSGVIPPTGSGTMADPGIIWLWLTEKPAAERAPQPGDNTPASEYLGQAGRFIIYISAGADALAAWPTAENDILLALQSTAVNFDTEPLGGRPVNGFQVRLRPTAAANLKDASPLLLADIGNLGPMKYRSMTNDYAWQLEVDGRWYVTDGKGFPVDGHDGYAISRGALLDVVPGQPWTNLPLVLDAGWRIADPEELRTEVLADTRVIHNGNPPLKLSPGGHTVRLAVVASSISANGGSVRAISNPVDIEIRRTNSQSPKTPETILAELRNILPEDWTCKLNRKPGKFEWSEGQVEEPLFRIDFTNLNISFNTKPAPPHGLRGPPHPGLPLYFVSATEEARVHWENYQDGIFPRFAETPDYFVVTSEREINGGVFSVDLQRSIEPLFRALEKYFGKLAYERTGGLLRVYGQASDVLTSDCGFAGQVVDDQTGKPIKEFTLEFSTNDPTIPGGRLVPARNGVLQSASTFFGGRFALEGRNFSMGPLPERGLTFNGEQWWEKGQKVWPQIHADGYLTEPVTPEPVVWPVKLTNIVVRLKRPGASPKPATNNPALPSSNPQSEIRNPQSAITNGIQYAAGFVPEKSEIALGEPLSVAFKLTNTSDRTIYLEVGRTDFGDGNPFRFRATDAQGGSVPDPSLVPNQSGKTPIGLGGDYLNPFSAIWGLNAATPIDPGRIYSERVVLSAGGIFKQPREYSIIASREIHLYKERIVRPGSQRDFSATGYETFPPDVLSTNGAVSQRLTNVFKLKILPSPRLSNSPASDWGEPVNGFQVRLRAPAAAEPGDAPPRLSADIANLGLREFHSMTNYFAWQVEVDGQWYTSDADMGGTELDVVPGQPWTNLPLVLDSAWRVAEPQEIGIDPGRFGNGGWGYPGQPPLKLSPGKHTVRLAVVAVVTGPRFAGGGEPVRALSNPVDIEVRTNVSTANPGTNASGSTSENPQSAIRNPQSLSGRVVDDVTGEPIGDFVMQIDVSPPERGEEPEWSGFGFGTLIQQRQGVFTWRLPLPGRSVRVMAPGYVPQTVTVESVTNQPVPDLEFRLKRGDDFHGVVLDDAGRPVPGAQVFLTTLQRLFLNDGKRIGNMYNGNSTTTDSEGRFVLRGMGGTLQRIAAVSPDGLLVWPAAQSAPGEEIKVTLPKPGTVIVSYKDPGDEPQAKLSLSFDTRAAENGKFPFWTNASFSRSVTVTNGGEAVLTNMTPGTYVFLRSKTGANGAFVTTDRRTVVIEAGQTQRIEVARTGGPRIRGQVVGLEQAKAAGGTISVRSAEATGQHWPFRSQNYAKELQYPTFDLVQFGADGKFETKVLDPGAYTVVANVYPPQGNSPGRPPMNNNPDFIGVAKVTVTADPMPPVSIKLAPALYVDIAGQVVDDETGAPLHGVTIQIGEVNTNNPGEISWTLGSRGTIEGTPGGGTGQFTLTDQKEGTAFSFRANGYLPQTILRDDVIASRQTTHLQVRMKRGGELRGVVDDYAGEPVAGATVYLAPVELGFVRFGPLGWSGKGTARVANWAHTVVNTDAAGRFSIQGAGTSGPRIIVVSSDGQMVLPVQPAATGQELKITLPKPAALTVRYDIPGDQAETYFGLSLHTNELELPLWKYITLNTGGTVTNGGQIVLSNLTPGTYDFSRRRMGGAGRSIVAFRFGDQGALVRSDLQKVVLESGRAQQINLVRSAGQRVQGQLTWVQPITNLEEAFLYVGPAPLIITPSDYKTNMFQPCFDVVKVDQDGHFQTALLEPGNYTLVVEGYVKGERTKPKALADDEPRLTGFAGPLPLRLAYAANAKVTVTTNAPPPPVKIQMEQWEPPTKAEEVQHALIHVQFEPDIPVAEEYCAKLLEEYTNSPEILGRIHLALASNLGSGRHPYQPATIAKMIEASRKALQYPLEVLDACRAYEFLSVGLRMETRKDRNVPATPAQRREILDVDLTCLKLILSKATTLEKQPLPGVPMMDLLYVVTPGQDIEDNPEYKANMQEHEAQMKAHDDAKAANELVDYYERFKGGVVGGYLVSFSAEEITEEGEKIMPGAPVLKELVEAVKKSNAPPSPPGTNLPPNGTSNRVNDPPAATNVPAPAPAPANPQSAIRNPQSAIVERSRGE